MNDTPAQALLRARDGATLILTLNYPARRNALSMNIRTALITALEDAEADPAIRAIVITGSEGNFSAGGDISGMNATTLGAGRRRFATTHRLVRALIRGTRPVLAAVEGYAVGAGLSLALCCDTIVAAQDARFGAGFGRIGLIADLGLIHTLPARIGMGRARQVLLYGEQMDAANAERIGMIDHVVPKGEALTTALERARLFHGAAPLPIAMTRALLAEGLDAMLDRELDMQSALFLTADHVEGREAFLARRAPRFTGD